MERGNSQPQWRYTTKLQTPENPAREQGQAPGQEMPEKVPSPGAIESPGALPCPVGGGTAPGCSRAHGTPAAWQQLGQLRTCSSFTTADPSRGARVRCSGTRRCTATPFLSYSPKLETTTTPARTERTSKLCQGEPFSGAIRWCHSPLKTTLKAPLNADYLSDAV